MLGYKSDPAIESHLNRVFEDGAKQLQKSLKDKIHTYKIRGMGYTAENGETGSGRCKVLLVKYDRELDCDVMTFEDIDTGITRSICQFEIFLKDDEV